MRDSGDSLSSILVRCGKLFVSRQTYKKTEETIEIKIRNTNLCMSDFSGTFSIEQGSLCWETVSIGPLLYLVVIDGRHYELGLFVCNVHR